MVYGDVNMDGMLDQVEMEFTGDHCLAYVSSIYPHQKTLFVEPLCEEATWWGSMALTPPSSLSTEEVVLEVSPVIVKRCLH